MEINAHILTDFQQGNIEGFYSRVYPSLITYAARYLGARFGFLAEDCVQDAVYQAYRRRDVFETPLQFKSFLYASVHNNAVSVLRKHKSRIRYMEQMGEESEVDFSNSMIEQETLDLLYEAISRLPADLYQIFELSFEQGMKNADVGRMMNISESAVKKKKAKMISLLRDMFADNQMALLLIGCLLGESLQN